jgi:hypothetical protein
MDHGMENSSRKEQIKVGQDQIDAKTYEFGSPVEKLAEFEEGLEDPEEFLAALKEKCLGMDAECEERQQTRQAEMRHAPRLWQF